MQGWPHPGSLPAELVEETCHLNQPRGEAEENKRGLTARGGGEGSEERYGCQGQAPMRKRLRKRCRLRLEDVTAQGTCQRHAGRGVVSTGEITAGPDNLSVNLQREGERERDR